jgi:DnaJ homolog subfamily C member 28
MLPPRSLNLSQLFSCPLLKPSARTRQHLCCLHTSLRLCSASQEPEKNPIDFSASQKLFADAANEDDEVPPPSQHLSRLLNEDVNWTGEEPMEHAVLRMLVDKHKPLRTGVVRTAEEKIRQASPKIVVISPTPATGLGSTGSATANVADLARYLPGDDEIPAELRAMAAKPLLQPIEGHRPWHTTYKAPSHATASIRVGRFPPPSSARPSIPTPTDERKVKIQKQAMKRQAQVGRLTQARESMLDYRLSGKDTQYRSDGQQQYRPNPVSLRAWTSLIEDRIDVSLASFGFDLEKYLIIFNTIASS